MTCTKTKCVTEFIGIPWKFLACPEGPGSAAAMAAASAAVASASGSSSFSAVFPRVLRFFFAGLGL